MKLKFFVLLSVLVIMYTCSFGQDSVSTGASKYVLVEEATGAWCGYCPDGEQVMEQQIKAVYPKANVISWHGPAGEGDPMDMAGDPYCSILPYDSLGFPSGMIDRMPYHPFGGPLTYCQDKSVWATDVAGRLAATANFQVDMACGYNSDSRVLTVTVTGTALSALTGNWNINAYVTEDSVSSADAAYQQRSYMYTDASSWYYDQCKAVCPGDTSCAECAILPDSIYKHMQVARAILATVGIWGDTAFTNPASGAMYSETYTYTIPAGYNAAHMKVIGLVQKNGPTVYARPIENSITSSIRLIGSTEVHPVYTMTGVELLPNPAQNTIIVKGILSNPVATRIVINNTLGRVVLEKNYAVSGTVFAENIELGNMSNGVYFMQIINNGETVTRRFIVSK